MRLALVCLCLFTVPALSLAIGEFAVSGLEDEFLEDAKGHVATLENVRQLDPSRLHKIPNATAIARIVDLHDGSEVARAACGVARRSYEDLFPRLAERCDRLVVAHRIRSSA